MAIVARILHRNWIVGPVWLQMLALELANVGRQPRPPSLPNRNKRRRRRATPSPQYTPHELPRSVRRTACRHFSRRLSALCLRAAGMYRRLKLSRAVAAANSQRSMGASRRKRVPFSFCYTWRPLLNSAICRG